MEMIRCPNCKTFFRKNDLVAIDEFNTVIHQDCLDIKYSGFVKHSGTYDYIKKRYSFLTEKYSED